MIKLIIAIISVLILSGCRHEEHGKGGPKEPAPMTVLVYMAANNSLGRDYKDRQDIDEMIKAARAGALSAGARVLVYRSEYYNGCRQALYELKQDSLHTIKSYSGIPATDPERLRQVIADTRSLAPADGYGLVLWSHSLGWTNNPTNGQQEKPTGLRTFGEDRTTGRMMTISELGDALGKGEFRYIYFDCCLMGSVEVAYELREAAPLIGCSVTETPYDGLPYDKSLAMLADGSRNAMIANAQIVADHYGLHSYGSCPVSTVVLSTEGLDELAGITADIYASSGTLPEGFTPQEFYKSSTHPEYRYFDFEEYVEALATDDALLADWRMALADVVIHEAHSNYVWLRFPILRHCGLSTRILFSDADRTVLGYDRLQWHRDVVSRLNIQHEN